MTNIDITEVETFSDSRSLFPRRLNHLNLAQFLLGGEREVCVCVCVGGGGGGEWRGGGQHSLLSITGVTNIDITEVVTFSRALFVSTASN